MSTRSIIRKLARPPTRALKGETVRDADAMAYVSAAESAKGSPIPAAHRDAIHRFVVEEKTAGRWQGLKRFFLPVWGNAAANAICVKSLASGTWINGATQGPGYVQGNGSTQHFDFGASFAGVGATATDGMIFALVAPGGPDISTMEAYATIMGARTLPNTEATSMVKNALSNNLLVTYGAHNTNSAGVLNYATQIYLLKSTVADGIRHHTRTSSGAASGLLTSTPPTGTSTANMTAMALNAGGSMTGYGTYRLGAMGMGLGLTNAGADAFTLNLKTLWETLTGQSLP